MAQRECTSSLLIRLESCHRLQPGKVRRGGPIPTSGSHLPSNKALSELERVLVMRLWVLLGNFIAWIWSEFKSLLTVPSPSSCCYCEAESFYPGRLRKRVVSRKGHSPLHCQSGYRACSSEILSLRGDGFPKATMAGLLMKRAHQFKAPRGVSGEVRGYQAVYTFVILHHSLKALISL